MLPQVAADESLFLMKRKDAKFGKRNHQQKTTAGFYSLSSASPR
jgi:hypothetical protein